MDSHGDDISAKDQRGKYKASEGLSLDVAQYCSHYIPLAKESEMPSPKFKNKEVYSSFNEKTSSYLAKGMDTRKGKKLETRIKYISLMS
jgi:hypothetical protein